MKNKVVFKPTNLSGCQQQRVSIARSLMNNRAIILADEQTGNLDTKTGNVFALLMMLSRKYRRMIVMVTHNPELAEATDRAIYVRDGTIERSSQQGMTGKIMQIAIVAVLLLSLASVATASAQVNPGAVTSTASATTAKKSCSRQRRVHAEMAKFARDLAAA